MTPTDGSDKAPEVASRFAKRSTRYAAAVLLIVAAHVLVSATFSFIGPAMTSLFLAAVIVASLYGGRGPGLVATLLGSLDLAYSFARPYNSMAVVFDDVVWLIAFMATALLTSSLQARRVRAEESLREAHRDLEKQVAERTAALVQSQEQYTLLVNGVVDQAVFMVDQDSKLMSWNAGASRLLGFTDEEVLGRPMIELFPGFAEGLRSTRTFPVSDDQGWIMRKDGGQIWATVRMTPLQDASGLRRGYAVSIRDITQQRSLEQEIVETSDRERQRISHDLHDGLGQELTGIAMMSTALAEQLAADHIPAADEAEKVADLTHQAIRHTRELARALYPADLESEGLFSALKRLCERIGQLPKIKCAFDAASDIEVDLPIASHVFRIAQEAISNALRHGGATSIDVTLRQISTRLTLTVNDNGRGFDPADSVAGMGLRLMEYRAKAIRGSVRIAAGAVGGTVVECVAECRNSVSR